MLSSRGYKSTGSKGLVSVDGSRPSSAKSQEEKSQASSRSRQSSHSSQSSSRKIITLHRHSRSRSPEVVTSRKAAVVHVESKLGAIACSSLSDAFKQLKEMIHDWLHKHMPASLKRQRFETSDINMDIANAPYWAAVFDLDETVLHYSEGAGIKSSVDTECRVPREVFHFLNFLRYLGVKIVYVTARREKMKNETLGTLESMGMWRESDLLVLKPDKWPPESSSLYKSHARQLVYYRGYSLLMNAGDYFSDLMVWTKWKQFMDRVRTELPADHILRMIASHIRSSESGVNQLKQFATSINFPIIFYALESNIPFSLKLPQQDFFTK